MAAPTCSPYIEPLLPEYANPRATDFDSDLRLLPQALKAARAQIAHLEVQLDRSQDLPGTGRGNNYVPLPSS